MPDVAPSIGPPYGAPLARAPTAAGTGPLAFSIRSSRGGAYPAAGGRGWNRMSASIDPAGFAFQNAAQSSSVLDFRREHP